MTIELLSPDTIGKIAAGEVVERPMSVVKELIENAIDAEATEINVEIAAGGSRLIRVSDNGHGMDRGGLELAVQRHATSKLTEFDDLDTLHTLGFRGEALPSIGAVSRLELRSSAKGAAAGGVLVIDCGRAEPARTQAVPQGTTVTVEDLFANVPARRKFLRQPGTESSYVTRLVGAYACHRSDIRWSLTVDGRRTISTDGRGSDESAAIGVFGSDLVDDVLPLTELTPEQAVPGVSVTGWVSTPRVTRSHRQNLYFFVNGRLIQHRSLMYALEEAYHSLLMVGRHPIGMVRIELDPAMVDINVHPTKAEVKFADERAVARAVQRAAHQALTHQHQEVMPDVTFTPPVSAPSPFSQNAFPNLPARPQIQTQALGTEGPASEPEEERPAIQQHPSGVPVMRVLGQVGGTYIIAEGPGGMFLIDQHAAHERIMYEQILKQMREQGVDRQPLLDPLIVELGPDEMAAFERSTEELGQIGFIVERFGDQSVVVREVPAIVQGVDIAERLRLVLGELAEGGVGTSWLDSVAISAACHTSIRAGQVLSLPEMREIVAQLERTEQPRACGHGRPTMLHMSQGELERQFARK